MRDQVFGSWIVQDMNSFMFLFSVIVTPVENLDSEPLFFNFRKEIKMSSRKTKGKTTKKRAQRATSNVFAMFDQAQIQEFKEAFNMIDQNRDGFIDKEDLHDMLASLGKNL